MSQILCSASAFEYYRIPPQVLALMKDVDSSQEIAARMKLPESGIASLCLTEPISFMVENGGTAGRTAHLIKRYMSWPFPEGAVVETEKFGPIASPEFTLFTLAREIPVVRLIMCMYEMCGNFAVFQPDEKIERALEAKGGGVVGATGDWKRVADCTTGELSNLWMRPPLTSKEKLLEFAEKVRGRVGSVNFQEAIKCLGGPCSSPLEIQASMLLSVPTKYGGEGVPIRNNVRVELPGKASKVSGHEASIVDIMIDLNEGKKLGIECQGSLVHDNDEARMSDADRATALQTLGIDVVYLTYRQISNEERFHVVGDYVRRKMGMRRWHKRSDWFLRNEEILRKELFGDWEKLPFQTYEVKHEPYWWY